MKPLSFFLIIVGSFFLKQKGFFSPGDERVISKIAFHFTLPCAIIQAFSAFENDMTLLLVTLLGFLCGAVVLLTVSVLVRRLDDQQKVFYILNMPGYNIGSFALPIVQALYPSGALTACMFDIGNSIIVTGISYLAASSQVCGSAQQGSVRASLLRLFHSVPFDTNVVMLILALVQIPIPDAVLAVIQPFASANAFLCMMMLGLMMQPSGDAGGLRELGIFLGGRLLLAAAFSALVWFVLPFSLEVRIVLVLVLLAPASALTPVFTQQCGVSPARSGTAVFVSVLTSMVTMIIAAFLLGGI